LISVLSHIMEQKWGLGDRGGGHVCSQANNSDFAGEHMIAPCRNALSYCYWILYLSLLFG
jgi:hypothetical protein